MTAESMFDESRPPGSSPRRGRLEKFAVLAARVLCLAGVPELARWRSSGRLAILMFHGVEGEPLSPRCDYVHDTATLRRQLEYVRRHFQVLPLEEALDRLQTGTLPRHAATLTFDDGTRNLAIHAAPVLRDLDLPAAVFLATGPMGTGEALWPDRLWIAFANTKVPEIDLTAVGLGKQSLRTGDDRTRTREMVVQRFKRLPDDERLARVESLVAELGPEVDARGGPFQLLSWDDARELARGGLVSLYPHTVTHPILSQCSDEKINYEISESCLTVERQTGRAPTIFAYPNGGEQDFDDRAKSVLCRNGVRWSLSTTNGFADRGSDPFALPRIGIGSNQSMDLFRLKVSGVGLHRPYFRSAELLRRRQRTANRELGASG
jgi:peptidoglycan/xylan/chitin deacetylase (PgdA/CDA1 family)